MEVVIGLLAAMGLIVVLVLTMPVRVSVSASGGTDTGFAFIAGVRLFAGFFGIGVSSDHRRFRLLLFIAGRTAASIDITGAVRRVSARIGAKERPEKKPEPAKKKPSLLNRIRNGLDTLRTIREATHIVFRIVRIDRMVTRITLGLLNPAATGRVAGVLFALNGALPPQFKIEPSFDFTREVLHGTVSIDITIRMLRFWRELCRHMPELVSFARGRLQQSGTLLAQEV